MMLIALGVLTAASLICLCARLNLRRVFGYGFLTDLTMMVLLAVLFHGTFSGMTVACIAGLTCSGAIYVMRRQMGYERYDWQRQCWRSYPADPIWTPEMLQERRKDRTKMQRFGLFATLFSFLFLVLLAASAAMFGYAVTFVVPFLGAIAAAASARAIRYL